MCNLWFPSRGGSDNVFSISSSQFLGKASNWSSLGQVIMPTAVYLVRSEGTVTLKHGFSHLNWGVRKGDEPISKRRVEGIVFQKIKQVSIILSNFISRYSQLESSPLIVNVHNFLSSASVPFTLNYLCALYGFEAPLRRRCPCLSPLLSVTFVQEFPLKAVS